MTRSIRAVSALVLGALFVVATSVNAWAPPKEKQTICHKPGTPAEQEMEVPEEAVEGHVGHGDTEGPCVDDQIIDADGITTAGDGVPEAVDVEKGDELKPFPDGGLDAGLDMFDQDSNAAWTQGVDDLHVEDPSACPTAFRNAVHDLGDDCKVLDLNGDLADGDTVDCDISIGLSFSGMPCPPPDVKFHDANDDGSWTPGEDLVQDVNADGVYS